MQGGTDWSGLPTTSADSHQTITLTVLAGQELVKTVQDVGSMAFTEFAALYAVGTYKTTAALLQVIIECALGTQSAPHA